MIAYLLVPLCALVMVVSQVVLVDLLSLGAMRIEMSLVLVIYSGFYLDTVKGGILVLILGFCLDTLTGTIPCFYTLFYVVIFFAAKAASFRVFGEGTLFIMIFVFICYLVEGISIGFFYWYAGAVFPGSDTMRQVLLQGVLLAFVSPLFFTLFKQCEGVLHAGTSP